MIPARSSPNSLLNQLSARLGQDLDRDIVGDQILLDDLAHETHVGIRGGGKPNLDFLEAELQQQVEHAALALRPHRLDQRLIAVAQIDRAPARRLIDDPRGPRTIGQVYRGELSVLVNGHHGHGGLRETVAPDEQWSIPAMIERDNRMGVTWPEG
jgi:hypothetical protein